MYTDSVSHEPQIQDTAFHQQRSKHASPYLPSNEDDSDELVCKAIVSVNTYLPVVNDNLIRNNVVNEDDAIVGTIRVQTHVSILSINLFVEVELLHM